MWQATDRPEFRLDLGRICRRHCRHRGIARRHHGDDQIRAAGLAPGYDDNHDPAIGHVGAKDQIVELDIAGEYFRGDSIAHCFAEELHQRFDYWQEQGVDGLSVRVDRGWHAYTHHDCILHEVQESNLWCLGQWMTGADMTDIDTPLQAWATERFGAECVAPTMAKIARLCDAVVKEALTVCGEPFGDTRRPAPALRSMVPPERKSQRDHLRPSQDRKSCRSILSLARPVALGYQPEATL